MLLADLIEEAERQLTICNSCRYCAGYCSVWPALERHAELDAESVTDLANLCHDCRDCFDACMYTAPHEFDLNPPELFAAIRESTYEDYAWPGARPAWLRGPRAWAAGGLLAIVLLLVLGALTTAVILPGKTSGSAYDVVGHWALVAVFALPAAWAVLVFVMSCGAYWEKVHGSLGGLLDLRGWGATLAQAATLRHQTGGGEGCTYPTDVPSQARRRWHHLVSYGFLLTFFATVAAAIAENLLGQEPPYPYLSVPVLSGLAGGVSMTVGCVGLLVLKRRAAGGQTTPGMRAADFGLLWALLTLAVTGILVLLLRDTAAFSPLLLIHLAAVLVAFVLAPYTKFMHWVYRLLAMYGDNMTTRTVT